MRLASWRCGEGRGGTHPPSTASETSLCGHQCSAAGSTSAAPQHCLRDSPVDRTSFHQRIGHQLPPAQRRRLNQRNAAGSTSDTPQAQPASNSFETVPFPGPFWPSGQPQSKRLARALLSHEYFLSPYVLPMRRHPIPCAIRCDSCDSGQVAK